MWSSRRSGRLRAAERYVSISIMSFPIEPFIALCLAAWRSVCQHAVGSSLLGFACTTTMMYSNTSTSPRHSPWRCDASSRRRSSRCASTPSASWDPSPVSACIHFGGSDEILEHAHRIRDLRSHRVGGDPRSWILRQRANPRLSNSPCLWWFPTGHALHVHCYACLSYEAEGPKHLTISAVTIATPSNPMGALATP